MIADHGFSTVDGSRIARVLRRLFSVAPFLVSLIVLTLLPAAGWAAPVVNTVSPAFGTNAGGTSVTIYGSGFTGTTAVTFGGVPATALTIANDGKLMVTTPAGATGPVSVTVTTPSGTNAVPATFRYVQLPVLTSVTPGGGPITGGTVLTVSGSFLDTVTSATVASIPVAITNLTPTSFNIVAPPKAVGSYRVVASNADGTSNFVSFRYYPAPTITSISPPSGAIDGGTSVTVEGTDFYTSDVSTTVTINGITRGGNLLGNKLTFQTPPGVAGPASVVINTASGSSPPANNLFTYVADPPTVTAVSPTSGGTGGGTTVTLTGTNFGSMTSVSFNGVPATNLTVTSTTSMTVTTPPGTAGLANIVVTGVRGTGALPASFTYVKPPAVTGVSPNTDVLAGGKTITLQGANFTPDVTVAIGGVQATGVVVTSPSSLTAIVPAGRTGSASVTVSNVYGSGSLANGFTYIAAPVVTSLSPNHGSSAGNGVVTVNGGNFTAGSTVTVGGRPATVISLTGSAQLSIRLPAGNDGPADVVVTTPYGTGSLANGLTYYGSPTITAISPATGVIAGGTALTVTGTNFAPGSTLSIGSAPATGVTVVSPTQLTATLPAGTPGSADVKVVTPYGSATLGNGFSYLPVPVITGVSPSRGPNIGNNEVIISGTDFTDVTKVTIGGLDVRSFTVVSPTQIKAIAPIGTAGPASIVVTTAAGRGTAANAYVYYAGPTVTAVSPSYGAYNTPTTITVTGTNFFDVTSVTVGGYACTDVTVVSPTELRATAQPGRPRVLDVSVNTPAGRGTLPLSFTYVGVPVITAVSPASAPYTASTPVTITGTDFIGVTDLTIGGTAVSNFTVRSPTEIAATLPAGTPGAQDITVTNGIGTGLQSAGFTRIGPPGISQVSPNRGPLAGGTVITVTGTNFVGVTGLTVGGASVTGLTVNSPTEITATVPAGTRGAADVVVTTASGQASSTGGFTYMGNPAITDVSPNAGPYSGGTSVVLTCSSTDGLTGVTIGGRSVSDVRILSPTQVSLKTPSGPAGAADIVVATSYGPTTVPAGFTYIGPPSIGSVTPSEGPVTGGTTITITGTDLAGASGVTIGGAPATAFTIVSDRQVTAKVPPGTAGAVEVAVTTPSGTDRRPSAFFYRDGPKLTGLSPASDDIAGGSIIHLAGSGLTGTTSVTFGGQGATDLRVVSDSEVVVKAPAGVRGTADVSVTTPWGTDQLAGGFVYTRLPSLTSLAPVEASIHGGAVVTLNGRNLVDVSGVTFNGVQAGNIHILTPRQMTVVAPPGVLGPASVEVVTADGHATLDGAFAYVDGPAPQITGLSVAHGPPGGGTSLIIRGEAFARASAVTFGGMPATRFEVIDDTSISAVTPPGTPGSVDVDVTTLYGSGSFTSGFSYLAAPAIASVSPAHGPAAGDTPITITGTDFDDATAVTIGGAPATRFTVDSSSQITAVVPAGAPGMARVAVTTPSGTGEAAEGYTYVPPPVTIALTPANAVLPDAPQGGAYQVHFVASGGAAPYSFQLASGTLPAGLTLDGASGLLSGKPEEEDRTHAFELLVRDANGVSARGSYTLTVTRRQLTVQDKDVVVQAGFPPPDLRLDDGATGGPFTGATVAYVDLPAAGTASIIGAGATGADATWSLRFLPAADFAGTVRVGYRLAAMGVESNTGIITYHIGKSRAVAVQEVQAHEKSFLAMRQAMLDQGIRTPGLTDRRTARRADDGVKEEFTPSADGVHLGLSLDRRLGSEGEGEGVDFWARAALMLRQEPASEATGKPGSWGSFTLASAGADYLVSERLLLGMALHVHEAGAPGSDGIDFSGKGWLAGPYASAELLGQTFLDVSLLYGQSANTIRSSAYRGNFDTSLWMLRGTLHGEMEIRDGLTLSPRLDATYISEAVQDHLIHNPFGETMTIPGFAEEQLRGSIGFDLREEFRILGGIVVSPSLGVDIGYAGLDGDGVYASVKPGIGIVTPGGWNLIGGVQMSLAAGGDVIFGISATASKRF